MQRWWLLGVAVLGIGLAVLLIPRPDTGTDIEPVEARPTPPPKVVMPEPDDVEPRPRVRPSPDQMRPGPPPGAEQALAERNKPESLLAKEMAAPWGGVRYLLAKDGSDDGKELAEKIAVHQANFAKHIREPEGSLDDLITAIAPVVEELRASRFMSDDNIKGAVERYDAAVAQWNTEKEQ